MRKWPVLGPAMATIAVFVLIGPQLQDVASVGTPGPTLVNSSCASSQPCWSTTTTSNPNSAGNGLSSVSCVSPSFCVAVGTNDTNSVISDAEIWNGSAWLSTPTPVDDKWLSGVSCVATNFCVAVGTAFGQLESTLALLWNGTSWTQMVTKDPGDFYNHLNAVSCASPSSCEAVGETLSTSEINSAGDALAERWNGSSWTVDQTPLNPPSAVEEALNGVSCLEAGQCSAVGYQWNNQANGPSQAFSPTAYQIDGASWEAVSLTDPQGRFGVLNSVSCTSSSFCVAVGRNDGTGTAQSTLGEQWNGTSWSVMKTSAGDGFYDDLMGVSCLSPTFCMAVGTPYGAHTLAEVWNGSTWATMTTTNPGGINELFGASCTAPWYCQAVGITATTAQTSAQTLAEQYAYPGDAIESSVDSALGTVVGSIGSALSTLDGLGQKLGLGTDLGPSPGPTDAVGLLLEWDRTNGTWDTCTATAVAGADMSTESQRSIVLTAAHCLYTGQVTDFAFAPGHFGASDDDLLRYANLRACASTGCIGQHPYGIWHATAAGEYYDEGYPANQAMDFAYIVFEPDWHGQTISDVVHPLPIGWNQGRSQPWQSLGYPDALNWVQAGCASPSTTDQTSNSGSDLNPPWIVLPPPYCQKASGNTSSPFAPLLSQGASGGPWFPVATVESGHPAVGAVNKVDIPNHSCAQGDTVCNLTTEWGVAGTYLGCQAEYDFDFGPETAPPAYELSGPYTIDGSLLSWTWNNSSCVRSG